MELAAALRMITEVPAKLAQRRKEQRRKAEAHTKYGRSEIHTSVVAARLRGGDSCLSALALSVSLLLQPLPLLGGLVLGGALRAALEPAQHSGGGCSLADPRPDPADAARSDTHI